MQQLSQQDADDLLVSDHASLIFDLLRFGCHEQITDHDGRASQPAGMHDEAGLSAFARAGSSAEQDDLFGESQVFMADFLFEGFPDRVENYVGVFDFQVQMLAVVFFFQGHGLWSRLILRLPVDPCSC